jgi:hypothetical protein
VFQVKGESIPRPRLEPSKILLATLNPKNLTKQRKSFFQEKEPKDN